jgi:fructose-1-phosphate kinase PfkB-like protein
VILTITLNAALDRTVAVPNFTMGRRHRAVESRTVAGGKGVNVARALRLLGRPVIATGLAGGATGTRILEQLAQESILHDFTPIEGESRTNLAVVDPTSGEQTEINERGPEVTDEELDRFVERLLYLARAAR